jgi:hypothetical protein
MYVSYKTVGFISDGVSCLFNRLGDKVFICSTTRDSFQVYRYDNLSACLTSKKLPEGSENISQMSVSGHDSFVSAGTFLNVFNRSDLVRVYDIGSIIAIQLVIGNLLLVLDELNRVTVSIHT